MRKIFKLIFVLLMANEFSGQDEVNFGDLPRPVPSVSSLATYTEAPVSLTTGVPDIKFPILGLSSNDKNIAANLSLQYHPLNMNETEAGSEVGIGWSMHMGGVISREIVDELDERYDDTSFIGYKKNKFDDIYYYNLPGISGKFKIKRNIDANTFEIINLTPNNIKIEYTKNSNNATLIIDSFTITDDNGYKYIFNDYNQNRTSERYFLPGILYKSAFYLSQIKNANNVELLNFSYQKDNKYMPSNNLLLYQCCKLKTIVSAGAGSIAIDYYYDATLENTMNDPYSITKVSLKNNAGNLISQYGLEYLFRGYYSQESNQQDSKRTLTSINKINLSNPAGAPLETTKLLYTYYTLDNNIGANTSCFSSENHNIIVVGSLHRMIMPTGGVIEYNYEANQYYINKSNPNYVTTEIFSDPEIQFIQSFEEVDFDTRITNNYTFQVTGEPNKLKTVYFNFQATKYYPTVTLPDQQSFVNYVIDNNPEIMGYTCYSINDEALEGGTYSSKILSLEPGIHTIKIYGTGGHGSITLSDIGIKPPPYKNMVTNDGKLGIRIKNIKYYNSQQDYEPKKTTSYDYNVFNDPNSVSGYKFYPEIENASSLYAPVVLYKNVKVINSDTDGYINYYFKNAHDFPTTPYNYNGSTINVFPYYNVTKSGVLEKKEIYNNQNQLVSSINYDFTFETLNNQQNEIPYISKAYIKSTKVTHRDYTENNQYTENKIETDFYPSNYKISSVKATSSDGSISEKTYKYALDKGNQKLITANMTGIDLETETKNNGKTVNKSEIKFENTGNLLPSSVISINPNDGSIKTNLVYDSYDSRGNLQQYTTDFDMTNNLGNSTVIIFGYNQTLPIAKIEGAKLSNIGTLANDIITKSNADINADTETALFNALDTFRNNDAFKNFQITTYTHNPLIGITTMIPPSGIKEIYKYDSSSNKLQFVVDINGNIIKEMKYNNKQ